MNTFSSSSAMRLIGFLFVLVFSTNCKKEPIPERPESTVMAESGGTAISGLSQTRTANLFNCFGEGVLLLWVQPAGDAQHVAADDGVYASSKKLSPRTGTLQLQLHDFRFSIPSGAIIESVTINTRRFKTGKGSIKDYFAHLIKRHDLYPTMAHSYGVRWSNSSNYPDAEATVSYYQNGSGSNGGLGTDVYKWTPAMINDLLFGLRITTYPPVGSTVFVYYDLVSITVNYSLL